MTLTSDQNKIFKALQPLEPKGSINFVTSLRIAHVSKKTYHTNFMFYTFIYVFVWMEQLTLKHRQNKNQKMKVVAFIGSPLTVSDKEVSSDLPLASQPACPLSVPQLTKLAKRLKKEKVTVDIVNFGETVSTSNSSFHSLSH